MLIVTKKHVSFIFKSFVQFVFKVVAANPLAATRCFHWTVKLVIRMLFNCDNLPGKATDSIAAHEEPGIFGYVRAYLGVVEPQMRKALHLHMLARAPWIHPFRRSVPRRLDNRCIPSPVVFCREHLLSQY